MPSALLAIAMLLPVADPPDEAAKKELQRLQGTWTMAGLQVEGKDVPEEKLKDTTLTIKGDKYITTVKGTARETTIQLDPTKKPKAIDMYFPDGTDLPKLAKGIYEIDGGTLRICRAQMAGQERPREFVSQDNPGVFIVTWKRR